MHLADPHRRSQVRRLHKNRVRQRRFNLFAAAQWLILPLRPRNREIRSLRQSRHGEQLLHHVLIHPRRGPQHPRPDIRQIRHLQQPLNRAILAERPMQHRKDQIQPTRQVPALLHNPVLAIPRAGLQLQRRTCSLTRQQMIRSLSADPMPLLGYPDGHNLILLPVDRLQNRSRGQQRNLMLPAFPAKQHPNPQLCLRLLHPFQTT